VQDHVLQILVQAVVGCPVEDAHLHSLIVIQVFLSDGVAFNDGLGAVRIHFELIFYVVESLNSVGKLRCHLICASI